MERNVQQLQTHPSAHYLECAYHHVFGTVHMKFKSAQLYAWLLLMCWISQNIATLACNLV
jgi:hypothetical protein